MDILKNPPTYQQSLTHSSRHFSDLGNTHHFIARHGHNIRYVPSWGWLIWDGQRWHIDDTDLITALAKDTILSLYEEVTTLPIQQGRQYKLFLEHIRRSSTTPRIRAIIDLARIEQRITTLPASFDTDPFRLTVQNGTINLRTGELYPQQPQDFITRLSPVAYYPDASSPFWDTFLAEITNHDPNLQQYLQRAVGYSLTGSTKEETLFLLYGPGRNGKSCFLSAINAVLGDYAQYTSPTPFIRSNSGNRSTTIPASLCGVRLLTTTETELGQQLDLSTIKRLSSGEPLLASRPHHEPISFYPQCKLWMATNHLPTISEHSSAIWQPIKLIPFPVSFIGREDRDIAAKLKTIAPTILAWAVQGCLQWQQHGLQDPPCILQATATYREEQDDLADFLHECCEQGNNKSVKAAALYQAYQLWCHHHQERTLSNKTFGSKILAHGYQRERRKTGKIYCGLGLNTTPPENPDPSTPTGA